MDFAEVIQIALPVVYVLVGAALVWLAVELVLMVRKTRKTVDEVQRQLQPTLANVEEITESIKPIVAKVDPLVERVSLTVDAANLEIMRVDQILEDVNGITGSLSSAVEAVDTAANAPLELVNSVSNKVRNVFKTRKASSESVTLGHERTAAEAEPRHAAREDRSVREAAQSTVRAAGAVMQDVAAAASEGADEARDHTRERKTAHDAAAAARQEAAGRTNAVAADMADAVQAVVESDATAAKEKYFTYNNGPAADAAAAAGRSDAN